MKIARIQPFCRANNINLGYFDGTRDFPGTVTERNIALLLQNNHFYLIWKSEGVSFNQSIRKLKGKFKTVNNYITEENVSCHFKYEFIPKKFESHLTNFFVYDLETVNTDRARPYNMTSYRLSKIAGRYIRVLTPYEIEKCEKDILVFDGDNCVVNAFYIFLKFKGEPRKTINKIIVEYDLQIHAHNEKWV